MLALAQLSRIQHGLHTPIPSVDISVQGIKTDAQQRSQNWQLQEKKLFTLQKQTTAKKNPCSHHCQNINNYIM